MYEVFVPRVSEAAIKRLIDKAVPIGTPEARARAWLRSQSCIRYVGDIGDKETGRIIGTAGDILDSGPRWESPQRIDIRFFFEDGKLSRVDVQTYQQPFVFP
jgi:hypothetical protein